MFRRHVPRPDKVRERAAKRLRLVATGEICVWAEAAINGFHRDLDLYRARNDQAAFDELRKSISMLAGAVDVLEERNQS